MGDLCATRGLCRPRKNPLKVEFQGDFLRAGFGGVHGHEKFEEHKWRLNPWFFGGFRVDQPIIIVTDWKLGATDLTLVPVDNHDGTNE